MGVKTAPMDARPAQFSTSVLLDTADDTARIARKIADIVGAGDVLLLHGPIGAGKTHFARSLIQKCLQDHGVIEDVPSPTFTLVQTYAAGDLEIWHADLYRLSHPDEVYELGLDDAFQSALCLIEWPDRLGDATPESALSLQFEYGVNDDARRVTFSATSGDWQQRLAPLLSGGVDGDE